MNPQKIAILTDSCADLTAEAREGKPIFVVPLKILCSDGEYSDGVDIFARDVYEYQSRGELPHTSLPCGEAVEQAFDEIARQGYEKVVAVMLSSGLSGTYNMVRIQGESRDDLEVRVYDSLSGALGMGMSILQIAADLEAGMSWEELTEERVPRLLEGANAFFSVDTLEYLQKGGRIGKVAALAGTMLNIKPIITFTEDGQLTSAAKVRGKRQVQDKFLDLLRKALGDHKRYNLAVANGGAPEEMAELRAKVAEAFPDYDHLWGAEIDATLSVYIGPGVLGAAVQILD